MAIVTTTVTGEFFYPDGTPAADCFITIQLTRRETDNGIIIPPQMTAVTDAQGKISVELWPNSRGVAGSQYLVTVSRTKHPQITSVAGAERLAEFRIGVPEGDPVRMSDIVDETFTPYVVNIVTLARDQAVQAAATAVSKAAEAEMYAREAQHIAIGDAIGDGPLQVPTNEILEERLPTNEIRLNRPQRTGVLSVRGGIRADYSPGRPLVSFIDDDAHERVYSYLYPILKAKGIPFGLAVPSNTLGMPGKLTLGQLREIVNTTGSEVLSHAYDEKGLNSLTDEEIHFEARESKRQLEGYGFSVVGYVPVGGQDKGLSGRALEIIDQYYTAIYVTQGQNNALPLIDETKIARQQFAATAGRTLADYKSIVDQAVANNEWLIFTTHVGIVPAYQDANHDAWLPELIDYVHSLGVSIVAPHEGLAEFGQVIRQGGTPTAPHYFRLDKSGKVSSSDLDAKFTEYDDSRDFNAGLDEYPMRRAVIAVYNDPGLPSPESNNGTLITYRPASILPWTRYGWQEWRPGHNPSSIWTRYWNQAESDGSGSWGEWHRRANVAGAPLNVADTPADIRAVVGAGVSVVTWSYNSSEASAAGLPTYGHLVTYLGATGKDFATFQTFHQQGSARIGRRFWDAAASAWSDWLFEEILKHRAIINFGAIPAHSAVAHDIPLARALRGSGVVANLQTPFPSGVMMTANCYTTGIVTVEAFNVTATTITAGTKDIFIKVDRAV